MATAFNAHTANDFLDRSKVYLIVDNLETMRKITIGQLRQLGAEKVLSARDGGEALRILRSQRVDVIISDWNMPVMTGIEFLRRLRKMTGGESPRVVFCTTENDLAHIQEALSAGANEYIMKPFDSDIIQTKFQQVGLL